MPPTTTTPTALRGLRKESGKRISDILTEARSVDPDFPTTHAGYLKLEERGTGDYWRIRALAAVFGKSPDVIAEAARPPVK